MTPAIAFILGLLMGACGVFLIFMSIGVNAAVKGETEKTQKNKKTEINDDLLVELFGKFIKERSKQINESDDQSSQK